MDNRDARDWLTHTLDKRACDAVYENKPAVTKLFNDLCDEICSMDIRDGLFSHLATAHGFYLDWWNPPGSGAVFIESWLASGDPLPDAATFVPALREWVAGYLDAAEMV